MYDYRFEIEHLQFNYGTKTRIIGCENFVENTVV
jgi:hypothetical protein